MWRFLIVSVVALGLHGGVGASAYHTAKRIEKPLQLKTRLVDKELLKEIRQRIKELEEEKKKPKNSQRDEVAVDLEPVDLEPLDKAIAELDAGADWVPKLFLHETAWLPAPPPPPLPAAPAPAPAPPPVLAVAEEQPADKVPFDIPMEVPESIVKMAHKPVLNARAADVTGPVDPSGDGWVISDGSEGVPGGVPDGVLGGTESGLVSGTAHAHKPVMVDIDKARPKGKSRTKKAGKARARVGSIVGGNKKMRRAVRRLRSKLGKCYQKGLAKDPTLEGTMELRLMVRNNGKIIMGKRDKMVLHNDLEPITDCIFSVLKRARFPKRKRGKPKKIDITLSFVSK